MIFLVIGIKLLNQSVVEHGNRNPAIAGYPLAFIANNEVNPAYDVINNIHSTSGELELTIRPAGSISRRGSTSTSSSGRRRSFFMFPAATPTPPMASCDYRVLKLGPEREWYIVSFITAINHGTSRSLQDADLFNQRIENMNIAFPGLGDARYWYIEAASTAALHTPLVRRRTVFDSNGHIHVTIDPITPVRQLRDPDDGESLSPSNKFDYEAHRHSFSEFIM